MESQNIFGKLIREIKINIKKIKIICKNIIEVEVYLLSYKQFMFILDEAID